MAPFVSNNNANKSTIPRAEFGALLGVSLSCFDLLIKHFTLKLEIHNQETLIVNKLNFLNTESVICTSHGR